MKSFRRFYERNCIAASAEENISNSVPDCRPLCSGYWFPPNWRLCDPIRPYKLHEDCQNGTGQITISNTKSYAVGTGLSRKTEFPRMGLGRTGENHNHSAFMYLGENPKLGQLNGIPELNLAEWVHINSGARRSSMDSRRRTRRCRLPSTSTSAGRGREL